jgi:hypothetical protein
MYTSFSTVSGERQLRSFEWMNAILLKSRSLAALEGVVTRF